MSATPSQSRGGTRLERALAAVERAGNRLPDPAMLFVLMLAITWVVSFVLSQVSFDTIDPRSAEPLRIRNLLAGAELTRFTSEMVQTFVTFHPLGVVLVALLGIGVAEHVGFINAGLRALLAVTSRSLLTPMLILVAILSHVAADAGYVLVIPLGAVIFHAAGRHPLAGIAAAFAGVSGGFSASFLPVSLDPLLAGLTQQAARVVDPAIAINPLNNWFFTSASTLMIVGLGWWLTDRVVEPRLRRSAVVDGEVTGMLQLDRPSPGERRGLVAALLTMLGGLLLLVLTSLPAGSAWRSSGGGLTAADAPLMRSIVALIFLLFLLPAIAYGVAAGTVRSHRDIIAGMTKSMGSMSYYLVLIFFVSLFIAAFGQSNLGVLIAVEGGEALKALGLADAVTLLGIVAITASVNLFIGSASAKWALLAPILVPMLMQIGISPDLTQAAYRVGDSTTNIITPLMPYFPLVVVFCQKYVRQAGIGTVVALMVPYTLVFLLAWSVLLVVFIVFALPLGLGGSLEYSPPTV
jgi:aminobenzoyl-glutamate transport protein